MKENNIYSPDNWIILKIKGEKRPIYKVLAAWSGGYLSGQSWRMNSGISKISKDGDFYIFVGYSGSIYKCHKQCYGTNTISEGVLSNLLSNISTKNLVEVVPNQDFSKLEVKND